MILHKALSRIKAGLRLSVRARLFAGALLFLPGVSTAGANERVVLAQGAPGQSQNTSATSPPVKPSDVVGRYAVLREDDRDTGCMVTLSERARGRGHFRAQLAPACRDHGIVVFDPVAWWIDHGRLMLRARKGHALALERDGEATWRNPKGKPLSFRKI